MGSIYEKYYKEIKDSDGNVINIDLNYDPDFNFAYDVVDEWAKESPDKTALVHRSAEGKRTVLTFGELSRLSNKAANALRELGIGKGAPVMLLLKRRYEYWILILAIHKLGAVAVPTSHMVSSEDIRERVEAASVKAVICVDSDDICERVSEALNGMSALKLVVGSRALCDEAAGATGKSSDPDEVSGSCDTAGGGIDICECIMHASEVLERVATKVTDDMLYYFTSGTNGAPKAVIHDHSYPLAHIYTAKNWHGMNEDDLHLTVADSGWAKSAWGKLYGQWFVGAAIFVYDYENFYASDMLKLLEEERVNTFCAPPTIYKYLLTEKLEDYDLSSVKYATTAGEPMPMEIASRFTERTKISIREGFGQTETALQICTPVGCDSKEGSIGKPSPLYHVELVDENGKPVANGEEGEIVIVPDAGCIPIGIFKGYLGLPELYDEVWKGGVYHTKDRAVRDDEGYYFFLGRNDDVIKSSGYRIGPSEVEDILMMHPAVFECAVTGYPSGNRGEIVKASIILKNGFEAGNGLKTELQDFVKERAAIYKYPRRIEFVDDLPRSSSGKISRAAIRKRDILLQKNA